MCVQVNTFKVVKCLPGTQFSNGFSIISAPGESAEIAEDMAARDVLRRMFKCEYDSSPPLPFSANALAAKSTPRLEFKTTRNIALANWSPDKVPETVSIV